MTRGFVIRTSLCVAVALTAISVAAGKDTLARQDPTWQPVWFDEFDTPGLPDSGRWSYEVGGHGWGNRELQFYTERRRENARVEGGRLIVEARREDWQGKQYTSARLNSRAGWTYGRIEVRAKLPRGRGTWPAIWMLPVHGDTQKADGPITARSTSWSTSASIPASSTAPSTVALTTTSIVRSGAATTMVADAQDAFHVYRVDWTRQSIAVYVDNIKYFSFDNERLANPQADWRQWPFDKDFRILLNTAVGGNWGGQKGVDESIWPQRLEIDYVRVFQLKG